MSEIDTSAEAMEWVADTIERGAVILDAKKRSDTAKVIRALAAERGAAEDRAEKAEAEVARLRKGLERLANSVHAFSPAWVQRTARDCLTPPDDPVAPRSTQEQ